MRCNIDISATYMHSIRGFAGSVPAHQLQALAANPDVASVEPDFIVAMHAQTVPWGIDFVNAPHRAQIVIPDAAFTGHFEGTYIVAAA